MDAMKLAFGLVGRQGNVTGSGDVVTDRIVIEKDISWCHQEIWLVLGLEIAVVDALDVVESDDGDELLEVLAGDVLLEAALGDLVEELAATDELHDEVDLGFDGHDLEELDDVGVPHATEDGDLPLDLWK
ncbi:hypothetical protein Droror1_Dr00004765 [Drosera rotundifolia]